MKVNHLNALLVEIMMAVLFFALSAAVILELFAGAHTLSEDARLRGDALRQVQNLSERLYASENPELLLRSEGFEPGGDAGWRLERGEYALAVELHTEAAEVGALLIAEVSAERDGEILTALPCARYVPGEAVR